MKVLIVSHNPVSDQSNMGKTFCSLFSAFSPEELCQLYIYPTIPNAKYCGAYFRITDKDVLRAVFTHKSPGGEITRVESGQGLYESPADARFYASRRNKSALRGLLRDAMWRRSGWYSEELRRWLGMHRPDVLFVAPGGAKFLYDFALEIGSALQIPIVTYLCDEYYFVKEPKWPLSRLRLRLLQEKMEALMQKTSHLVTISPELAAPYEKAFSLPATVLMTGAAIVPAVGAKVAENREVISYFGNIRCNRYLSLAEIGRELDAINADLGTQYQLKIYTAEQDAQILSALKRCRSVEICGFLSGDAFTQTLENARLLLHTEAFDEKSVDFTKHSVSTKIADGLASGIPLLAYGPESIASMRHLIRNACAVVATSKKDLRALLLTAFTDTESCRRAAEKGLLAAKKYHDAGIASGKLRAVFEDCL